MKLTPLKNALPDEFSWEDIKLCLARLGIEEQLNPRSAQSAAADHDAGDSKAGSRARSNSGFGSNANGNNSSGGGSHAQMMPGTSASKFNSSPQSGRGTAPSSSSSAAAAAAAAPGTSSGVKKRKLDS